METTKKQTYLKIRVGDLIADKENQKILKQLLWKEPQEFDTQALIDSCDTKIKRPRFE